MFVEAEEPYLTNVTSNIIEFYKQTNRHGVYFPIHLHL